MICFKKGDTINLNVKEGIPFIKEGTQLYAALNDPRDTIKAEILEMTENYVLVVAHEHRDDITYDHYILFDKYGEHFDDSYDLEHIKQTIKDDFEKNI